MECFHLLQVCAGHTRYDMFGETVSKFFKMTSHLINGSRMPRMPSLDESVQRILQKFSGLNPENNEYYDEDDIVLNDTVPPTLEIQQMIQEQNLKKMELDDDDEILENGVPVEELLDHEEDSDNEDFLKKSDDEDDTVQSDDSIDLDHDSDSNSDQDNNNTDEEDDNNSDNTDEDENIVTKKQRGRPKGSKKQISKKSL